MKWLVFILFLLFTISSTLVSLNRFWQYEVFYYDFGIFDRAIWQAAHFQAPIIDHLVVGGKWIFADHFNPSIFIFSPLYWLTNRSEILLIAQAVVVGLSGLVIYQIGKIVTKHSFFSLGVVVCYYLFIGLQNAVISDFHETTLTTLFITLAYYFFLKNRKIWFLMFFILILGFKESNFLLGMGMAVSIALLNKTWRKFSFHLIILSIIWGIVAIKLLIPYFSGGIFQYEVVFSWDKLNIIADLFDSEMKRSVVFDSLFAFGLLPIVNPAFWFVIIQDFLVRFLSGRVSLGLHYSAMLGSIMAIASIYSFSLIIKVRDIRRHFYLVPIILILTSFFLYRFVMHGPLALSYHPQFYSHTGDFKFLDSLLSKIPKNATVMTQNNLASHLTHQKKIWVLKDNYEVYKADYIIMDLRSGQSANNFFPTKNPKEILKKLIADPDYSSMFNNKNQYIFQRKP